MNKNGLLLWVMAGAGALFVFAAIKNVQPLTLLTTQIGVGGGRQAIDASAPTAPAVPIYSTNGIAGEPMETAYLTPTSGKGYGKSPKTYIAPTINSGGVGL